jgi:hypothetical protein
MEKYGAAKQGTDDNTIFSIRFVFWINKATNAHPEYITSLIFQGNNGYANASQCYVIRRLSSCPLPPPQHHNPHRIYLFKMSDVLTSVRAARSEDLLLCSIAGHNFIVTVAADPNKV